jgi:hypothetical protein
MQAGCKRALLPLFLVLQARIEITPKMGLLKKLIRQTKRKVCKIRYAHCPSSMCIADILLIQELTWVHWTLQPDSDTAGP